MKLSRKKNSWASTGSFHSVHPQECRPLRACPTRVICAEAYDHSIRHHQGTSRRNSLRSFIDSFATQLCETTLHDISHFHVHQMSGDLKEKLKTPRNYMEPAAPVMASIRAPFCLAVMVRTFSRQLMWPRTPRTTRKQQVWPGSAT